jgi:hypothetical protein
VTATQLAVPAAPSTQRETVRGATRAVALLGPPLVALVAGWSLIASRAPRGWTSAFDPATFDHRDAGQYLKIAEHGYRVSTHCNMGPRVHMCGDVTWFPGYPALIRMLGLTGLRYATAGLIIAWVCWYVTLLMVWVLSKDTTRRGTSRGIACLALAAFFPGQIYFAALFPIALVTAALLLTIFSATRLPRAAGLLRSTRSFAAGVVAGAAYPLAIALVPGLGLSALAGRARPGKRAIFIGAGGALAGLALVFAYAQIAVGRWNAYFVTEGEEYHVGSHNPLTTWIARIRPVFGYSTSALKAIDGQSLLVTVLVVVAIAVNVPHIASGIRHGRADLTDVGLLMTGCIIFLIPYVGAGDLSVYRAEACVIVLVPTLRRAPVWVISVLAIAAIFVAARMAPLFFNNTLI